MIAYSHCGSFACNHPACARTERAARAAHARRANREAQVGLVVTVTTTLGPDQDEKDRLLQEHRAECQQAFSRPPRKQGRGRPPAARWSALRPPSKRRRWRANTRRNSRR